MKVKTKIATACLVGLAALSVLPVASAAVVAGTLTPSDPTFNRTLSNCSTLSAVGTAVHYDVYNLSVSATGGFDLAVTADPGFDAFLAIYSASFNPASAVSNCYAADDDSGPGFDPALDNLLLSSVTQYFAVVTSFSNGATGDYSLSVVLDQLNTTGAQINLGGDPTAVPEPASLALLGLGLAGLGFSRRKQ